MMKQSDSEKKQSDSMIYKYAQIEVQNTRNIEAEMNIMAPKLPQFIDGTGMIDGYLQSLSALQVQTTQNRLMSSQAHLQLLKQWI